MNYKTDISTTRTITGANIELSNDYLENDISSIEIEGNTEQDGTPTPSNPVNVETVTGTQEISITGKSLLNPAIIETGTKNGITCSYDATTQTITFDGTCTSDNTTFYFNGSGEYVSETIANTTRMTAYYVSGSIANYITWRINNANWSISQISDLIDIENQKVKSFIASSSFTLATNNFSFRFNSNSVADNLKLKIMVANNLDTTYKPFKNNTYNINLGDMKLCRINDYKDKIFRSSGKNLFDKENTNLQLDGIYITSTKISSSNQAKSIFIKCKPNTTYTISKIISSRFVVGTTSTTPENNTNVIDFIQNNSSNSITISTSSNANYLVVYYYHSNYDTTITYQQILNSIQIEKGSVASEFEPYSQKGKWYIYKKIGKVVLDGSEEGWTKFEDYNIFYKNNPSDFLVDNSITYFNNYYQNIAQVLNMSTFTSATTNMDYAFAFKNRSDTKGIAFKNNDITTLTNWKNWLSNNNVSIYYILETPTVTEITDLSLLRQLEAIRLFDKINYITYTSSTTQPSTFRLNYKTSEDKYLLLNDETVMYSKMIVKATDTEDEIILTESNSLKNWTYDDDRYTPNVGFIGQFIARTLSGELQNIDDDFDIENREVQICFGIKDFSEEVSETRWYTLGSFIIQKPEDNEVTDNTTYDAMDLTILFNKYFDADFTDNEYTTSFNSIIENGGSVTALWLANYVCKQVGIPFGNNFFTNCDFVINSNQFVSGEMCRDVMRAISQLSYGWVRIGWDDVCYIDEIINDISEIRDYDIIDNDHYYSLTTQKKYFGPINKITVGMQDVNGEAISIQDSESVVNDGLTEVFVYDNPITYTNELRNTAVQNASYLLGMKYLPIETETPGHPWLKAYQPIIVKDMENRTYYSYPFNLEIKYAGHIRTTIKSPADTDVEKTESYDTTIYRTLKNLKIEVDKQAGVVTILNSNVQAALDGLEAFETRVEQTITDTYSKTEIQEIVNGVAPDGTKVTSVTTSSGTFDKDGLTIEQTTADTKTNINADGMIIYDKTGSTENALLTVNSNGVITKNLKVSTYTELGSNSRFEDFVTDDYEDATAVFWIGS